MNYICPICGYDKLIEPPYDENDCASFEICSCCGFEFGYDDGNNNNSFISYRIKWISNGTKWFNNKDKPNDWNLEQQLRNLDNN